MNSSKQLKWGSWQISGPRHYYREDLISKVIKRMLPMGRILDVGCGTGSLMIRLALGGYQVYGVDMSGECVRRTTEHLKLIVPNIHQNIKRCHAAQIDFSDGFFDAVIAAEVLEHIEEDQLAVQEFYRLLRPGGVCFITVPANEQLWDVSDEMAGHKRRYYKSDIVRLFEAQSFFVERVLFLGFPLMRLYHRLVFLKWARYIERKRSGTVSSGDTVTRLGLSRWITLIVGNLFRVDNLFSSLPWGIGILAVARKPLDRRDHEGFT